MRLAVYNGLLSTNSSSFDVAPNCLTGNCTFDPHQSMGVCSQCADISSSLTSSSDEDASTWTLPNGLFIEENGTIINVSGSGDLVNFKNVFGAISNISLIMTRDFYNYSEPLPAECILYFCVKTFNATVQNGVLTENVISNAIPHIRSGII